MAADGFPPPDDQMKGVRNTDEIKCAQIKLELIEEMAASAHVKMMTDVTNEAQAAYEWARELLEEARRSYIGAKVLKLMNDEHI